MVNGGGKKPKKKPKKAQKFAKNLSSTGEKTHVTVISARFQNENFGRRVTRNMPCRIDRNGTVLLIIYLQIN